MSNFKGFTLPELIVTMTIFVSLLIFVTLNLVSVKQRTSLTASTSIFVGDMRSQQLKAMAGDTEGRSTRSDYGIHFTASSYILFHGSTYSAADTSNYTVALGDNISFIGSPSDIVFARTSGELAGAASLTLQDGTTQTQKVITVNRYGVVTAVN